MGRLKTVPMDTTADADAALFAVLAQLSPQQKALRMSDLSDACTQLAVIGIRSQHPGLTEAEMPWYLCERRYGSELANEAFGTRS